MNTFIKQSNETFASNNHLQHTIGKICSLLKIVRYLEQTFRAF